MFFCEFCEISKNMFSYKTPPVAAPEKINVMVSVPAGNQTSAIPVLGECINHYSN